VDIELVWFQVNFLSPINNPRTDSSKNLYLGNGNVQNPFSEASAVATGIPGMYIADTNCALMATRGGVHELPLLPTTISVLQLRPTSDPLSAKRSVDHSNTEC